LHIIARENPEVPDMATTTRDSEAKAALARLLDNYSAELTTRDHKSLDAAADILRPQTRVFVAAMPRDTADDMIAAAIRLHKANMVAIPHIVARNIPDEATLDRMLARLSAEAGVDRAHVVGGDRDHPVGEYGSALELLETGFFQKYGIRRIALACYPEGHPRIADEVLEQARIDKMKAADEAGLNVWMVSQFAFESAPIIRLARNMRAQGIDVPYRVGVAGVTNHATLLKYAMLCGVGASLRALKERRGMMKSALGETPERLLTEIALAREAEPALDILGVHFFTFGSLEPTAKWVESIRG
ncbi:MAG: methylenetetrahydrofolate reductase, partial [Allosphingosinicella sp.]